jgi:hypothetical protein
MMLVRQQASVVRTCCAGGDSALLNLSDIRETAGAAPPAVCDDIVQHLRERRRR